MVKTIFTMMSTVITWETIQYISVCIYLAGQPGVPHQAPWLCCAPALFCPRWHSVSGARLPLAPGLFVAPPGFGSPAAPSNCLPWWKIRAVTMAVQRSEASHCVLSLYCYECWEEGKDKRLNKLNTSLWGCYSSWEHHRMEKHLTTWNKNC